MSRRATRMLLLALCVLLAGFAAACSSAQPQTTLDRVKDSGVLRVGTEGTYSPFSFHDPATNELTGYDVEIITAVADRMGVEAEFVEAPWDAIFASLLSDRFDVVANQVTKNAEREARYALSEPYTFSDGVIVTRSDDTSIRSPTMRKPSKPIRSKPSLSPRFDPSPMAARATWLVPIPAHRDRNITEPDGDRSIGFVNRGDDHLHPGIFEHRFSHPGCDSFDQVPALRRHDVVNALCQEPVVDGFEQIVGRSWL